MMRIHRRVGPIARTVVKRVPEVTQGTTSDSSSQAANTESTRTGDYAKHIVASSTPPSTIALAVLLAIAVVAFISGCVYWRIRRRRVQKSAGGKAYSSSPHSTLFGIESRVESVESESSSFGGPSANVEKPEKAFVLTHPFRNEETGWTPQVRNYRGVPLVNGELPRHVQAARDGKRLVESPSQNDLKEKPAGEITAPPTFVNGHRPSKSADARSPPPGIPLPPTPPETITVRPPTPPSQSAAGKKPKLSPPPLSKPTGPTAFLSSRFSLSPLPKTPATGVEPLPSPARISSFAHQQGDITPKSPAEIKIGTSNDGLPLPRMMSVINTFTPSLEDEMLVHIGDTVNMLEEYSDGWCLVQRIGKPDAPRGVVPRFCLVERQSKKSTRRNIIKSIQASAKRI